MLSIVRVLKEFRRPVVAIDVGTAVTRVSFGNGEVFEQPSVVHEEVRESVVVRPAMREGVVADIAAVAEVVHGLLRRRRRFWPQRPAAIVCAPTDVSEAERDALIDAVAEGGASIVSVVPEPLAAAVGARVDVASEYATALVDIGAGVTDFAVFRNGSIVRSRAHRVGCGALRTALQQWLDLRYCVTAVAAGPLEDVVRAYCGNAAPGGAVIPLPDGSFVDLESDELEAVLEPVIESMATFLALTVRELPDSMAAEVIESGISVTGGGATCQRIVEAVEREIGLRLTIAPNPLHAVIRGAREMLQSPALAS